MREGRNFCLPDDMKSDGIRGRMLLRESEI